MTCVRPAAEGTILGQNTEGEGLAHGWALWEEKEDQEGIR
jgi:hypothetical protein